MARKRYKKKRADYRKGGRVKYAHGGRPSRRDYESGDEYQVALEQWRNDPAHQGTSKAPVKPAASTPVQQPAPQPTTVQQPPQRQVPFREFDPAERDLYDTTIPMPQTTVAAPRGRVQPQPSMITQKVTDTGGIQDSFDTFPSRNTPLEFGSVSTVQRPDTAPLGLDSADQALLGLNQQQQTSVDSSLKNLFGKIKKPTFKQVAETVVGAVVNPVGTVFDLGRQIVDPILEVFAKNKLPVNAKELNTITDTVVNFMGSDKTMKTINFRGMDKQQATDVVVDALKAKGITEIDGKPIDQAVADASAGKDQDTDSDAPPDDDAPKGPIPDLGRAKDLASAMQTLYSGVGSSFESSRDAYTESGQYDIDREARQAEFDAMRAARGESVPRTPAETQQLLAEQRARIGEELSGGVMIPAATTTFPTQTQTQTQTQTGDDTVADDDTTDENKGGSVIPDNASRQIAQDIVSGTRQGPQIPTPQQVQTGPDAQTMQMGTVAPIDAPSMTAPTIQASQAQQAAQAQAPDAVTAAQMQAAQVTPQEQIAAATGAIGDDEIAKAAQVDRVAPIQAAEVSIPEGALTERVVGTLSPNATAIAAQAAGTTLSRVTRAKKQLRNAGISEQAITALGNNPEALEDRLMDLTQEERGVIGDLPEEALVSNQIDSLLKGMENGEIPAWASPAVSAVEQMLAQRGLSASTVGRDNLFNAIIQSAVPIAQSNAQAIQASVAQTRDIESREELANAQMRQQTALQNASNVFQMDMAQFNADQQTALSNSKFLQTVGLTEANNEQQSAIQNAMLMSQANLAEADFYQKTQIQNAQAFLNMDLANLTNEQQSNVLTAQQRQQTMLSNQAAQNAAAQFNATSENQTQQFMANLAAQIETTNVQQTNAMKQFNVQQDNATNALRFQVEADLEKANTTLTADINKFNTQISFNREQWNKQNAQAVEQSNIAWRRQINTINTAADNQVSMQNAMNAFNLNSQTLSFLWQELRDQADQDFKAAENELNRDVQLLSTAMANEGDAGKTYDDALSKFLTSIIENQ